MNANLQTNACDPEQLEALLRGDLSSTVEHALLLHLDSCASCRRVLQQQAADPAVWQEAEELLRPCEFDAPRPLLIQGVLDALGPTDDPAMLGRLAGYEISGVVGAGGMGVVLKALDKSLDRTVAIKVLAPHLAASGAARKRFAREAKAAAAVLHPNVIAIHGVSQESPLPYLVMPYLRGPSLQKRLDEQGPLPLPEILRIGAQIAAGLAAAHVQGLVHRDIKPANILLEDGVERVAITDFGLARAVDDATLTTSGVIAGTPQYMSPEQARGEPVDQRSDLFSLGSVLYATCTGRPPFRAETSHGVLRRITDDEPTAIREINPEIPDWLAAIISRLMAKRAVDRFASAGEVAELLEKCLAHVQQPAKVPLPSGVPHVAGRNSWRPSFLSLTGVVAMIAAAGIALLGIALLTADPPDIEGEWTGKEWGTVSLKKMPKDHYTGTYTDTFGTEPGTIALKWSPIERRFNGTWREGKDRFGKLSVRLVVDEIHGAHTTDRSSKISPGVPRLADLAWRRAAAAAEPPKIAAAAKPAFGPVREGVLPYGIPCEQQFFQFSSGKVFVIGHGPATSEDEFESDRKKMDEAGGGDISIGSNFGIQLVGEGCIFTQDFDRLHWDKFTAEQVVDAMKRVNFSFGVVEHANTDLPQTYLFKTSRGEVGILELLAIVDDGKGLHALGNGLKFRYKLVQNAAQQISASPATASPATAGAATDGLEPKFGPIVEKTLIHDGKTGTPSEFLDLDSGRTGSKSLAAGSKAIFRWAKEAGMDLEFTGFPPNVGLLGWRMLVKKVDENQWEAATPRDILTEWRLGDDFRPKYSTGDALSPAPDPDDRDLFVAPHFFRVGTYFFRSNEEGWGILQVSADEKSHAVTIRYKLVQKEGRASSQAIVSTSALGGPQPARQIPFPGAVTNVAYSANGKFVVVASEKEDGKPAVQIVAAATGEITLSLKLTTADEDAVLAATEHVKDFQVAALAFAPAGDVLAVGTSIGQVKLFHAQTGELLRTLDNQGPRLADKETPESWKPMVRALGSVRSLTISPDGSRIAICGESFGDFSDVFDGIESLGRSTSGPGRLKVFDIQTGKLVHDLNGHSQVRAVAISADGEWLASAGRWTDGDNHGDGVIVWDLKDGSQRTKLLKESNGGTHAVAFAPNRKLIAIGSLQFDKENDTRSTAIALAFPLSGITEWQQTIQDAASPEAFSPDGKSLVVSGGQSVRVFNVETGQLQHEIKREEKGGRWADVAVSPAGPEFAIGGVTPDGKGTLEFYTLPTAPAVDEQRQ